MHRHHRNTEPQSPAVSLLFGIFAVCFGIFWTIMAGSIFPPMALFGVLWTAIAVTTTVNSYKNAKKREEKSENPSEETFYREYPRENKKPEELRCPYCGAPIKSGDKKCEYCDSEF
ncbi:MAG: zinc ribbon domain-containing protein [Oscillospiraceae bacterium]|nr:zinc ribbon domain-containing protein [Oscillospiraceae bacterium]